MDTPEKWKQVSSEKVADCRVFRVRKDTSVNDTTGMSASFFVVENPDWINVIPITKQGELVLIEQFRHGTQEITLEIPGGMVDEGETPIRTAHRELLEETGYRAGKLVEIGKSRPNPAIQNNWIYHFLAKDCVLASATSFDEHENIVTKLVPVDEIPRLVKKEKITHALVIAAFHNFLLRTGGE